MLNHISSALENKLSLIPHKPGVYLYKNFANEIIYIGKAKDLFKRTHQYFQKKIFHYRLADLIKNINDVETIITNTELEALILEQNLIKKHLPKYNVLMKDDKHYPYICVSNETYPRFLYLRKYNPKKGKFYGPFPDGVQAREIIFLLNRIFPLRKCVTLPKKECLYFHIKQCLAPCINKIDKSVYEDIRSKVQNFFSGKNDYLLKDLYQQMENEAENLRFESAQEIKKTIQQVEKIQNNQLVEFLTDEDFDFVGYHLLNDFLAITIFFYRAGKLLTKENFLIESFGDYQSEMISSLMNFYEKNIVPNFIYLNDEQIAKTLNKNLNTNVFNVRVQGKKSEVLELASQNAKNFLENKISSLTKNFEKNNEINDFFYQVFQKPITSVDVIDASHLQTSNYVGVIINVKNNLFSYKDYRKYNLEKLPQKNDYDAIKFMLAKKYSSKKDLPDLLIVDGGQNQVNAALSVIEALGVNIIVAGLKKNLQHKTHSFIYNNQETLIKNLNKNVSLFFSRIQDEVHRYAISFYRKKASKSLYKTKLNEIKELNEVDINKLINNFETIKNIENASIEELKKVVSLQKARLIYNFFHNYLANE